MRGVSISISLAAWVGLEIHALSLNEWRADPRGVPRRSQDLEVDELELGESRRDEVFEAVDFHRERRQQKDGVALEDKLGVGLVAHRLAALARLGQVVVRREVLPYVGTGRVSTVGKA